MVEPSFAGPRVLARCLRAARACLGRALACLAISIHFASSPALAASNDDDVEWNGVYSDESFRSPQAPARGEAFRISLRVFHRDITAARVRVWDGEEHHFPLVWVREEGAHDIWRAEIAGLDASTIFYRFEITDGSDTDWFNALGMWDSEPARGDFVVRTTELARFPLGATVDGASTVFRVWAPNADDVAVAGEFNGWSQTANSLFAVAGVWEGRVAGARAGHRYKFVIERGAEILWRTDPRARAQTSSTGDSIIDESRYEWGDGDWVIPYFEDMVIYELHVGSFSGEGDGVMHHPGRFRDVVDRHLEHLLALGVNVLELMPLTEFAGDVSWGYNPSFQFAPESAYGTPDELRYLVDRCHQAGIAVILDVVFNHMGGTDLAGNLLDFDGEEIYFYPEGNGYRETPWGPRPDYGRREVREYLHDTVRYWMREFHIDGFRLDGTDFVKVNAEGWRLLQEIAEVVDTISPKAIVIAEQLPNDPAMTVPISQGGAGADAQWNDTFHDRLRDAIGAAAFDDPDVSGVVAGMNHFDFGGHRAVNYIESHDEAAVHGRVSVLADGSDPASVWARGRSKLAWGLVMFTSGIPMVLHGQEWLESRRFGDSRDRRIQWRLAEEHADFLLAARDMTRLRRELRALRADGDQNVFHVNEADNVIAWHRYTPGGDDVVILASFANEDFSSYCVGMPLAGRWFEVLNTDAAVYGGRNRGNAGSIEAVGGARDGLPFSACVTLPRMGVLVFAREPLAPSRPAFLRGDCNGDARVEVSDAVRHIRRLFGTLAGADCPAACDTDGDGRETVADVVRLLEVLFRAASPPPAPWPRCDEHTASPLRCDRRVCP